MGQYHWITNLDKGEYINAHQLDCGLKLIEQLGTSYGPPSALFILLAASNGRGGGDFGEQIGDEKIIGRWAGDRIAVIGDYAEEDDIPGEDAKAIYEKGINAEGFRNITPLVRPYLERELGIRFVENTKYEGSTEAVRDPEASWSVIPKDGEKPQTLAPDTILVSGPKAEPPVLVQSRKVVIEVNAGVAEVTECPEDVEIEIKDFDGDTECPECGEAMYEGRTCPHCGYDDPPA